MAFSFVPLTAGATRQCCRLESFSKERRAQKFNEIIVFCGDLINATAGHKFNRVRESLQKLWQESNKAGSVPNHAVSNSRTNRLTGITRDQGVHEHQNQSMKRSFTNQSCPRPRFRSHNMKSSWFCWLIPQFHPKEAKQSLHSVIPWDPHWRNPQTQNLL